MSEGRRPRLTPADELIVAPVDEASAASYAAAEEAIATKHQAGEKLDEFLALIDDGAVPHAELELGVSAVHHITVAAKKPPG